MQRSYTGTTSCCCKKEDCHVIENLDGYKNFYKSFEEEGVVWQPIKETEDVWNDEEERWESKEVLTDCKATVEDECIITLIDKTAKYKEDNIGIRFINAHKDVYQITDTSSCGTSYIQIEHNITFSGHKFCFVLHSHMVKVNEDLPDDNPDAFERRRRYYITFDDKVVYEHSVCYQEFPGIAFTEAAIIRKDNQAYFYAGSNLLEVVSGGKDAVLSYEFKVAMSNTDPVEIRYQDFQIWKPDKWWLFPERQIPYFTPSEIKKFSKSKTQKFKKIQVEGKKEKQGCRYPLRYNRMDIDPRLYCENLSFKICNLPKLVINSTPKITINLKQLSERHVLTWDSVPAPDIGSSSLFHDTWGAVSNDEYHAGYHTQAFSPIKVTSPNTETVQENKLSITNPVEIQTSDYRFEPSYAQTELTWHPADGVIFAPNICIYLGQGEQAIFKDIIQIINDPSVDDVHNTNQYFFKDITIKRQPAVGTAYINSEDESKYLVYNAPQDATQCVDIEYELLSVFGIKSKGVISIYIVDKNDPYYRDQKYIIDAYNKDRNAYVFDFWSYRGDESLESYHDDIILNRVHVSIKSVSSNSKRSILQRYNPCHRGPGYLPTIWLYTTKNYGFGIELDLYAGVHSRVVKLKDIKNLKYIYVKGASYTACVNRLGRLCKARDRIIRKLDGSIYDINDAFDSLSSWDSQQAFSQDTGVSTEDLGYLNAFKSHVRDWYYLLHEGEDHIPEPSEEELRGMLLNANKTSFVVFPKDNSFSCWYNIEPPLTRKGKYNGDDLKQEIDLDYLSNVYVKSSHTDNHVVGKFKHDIQNPYEPGSTKDLKEVTITLQEKLSFLLWSRTVPPRETNACEATVISDDTKKESEHTVVITNELQCDTINSYNVPRLLTDLVAMELPLYRHCEELHSACPDLFDIEYVQSIPGYLELLLERSNGYYETTEDVLQSMIDANKECWDSLNESDDFNGYLGVGINLEDIDLTVWDNQYYPDTFNILKGPVHVRYSQCNTDPNRPDTANIEVQIMKYLLKNTEVSYYGRM